MPSAAKPDPICLPYQRAMRQRYERRQEAARAQSSVRYVRKCSGECAVMFRANIEP